MHPTKSPRHGECCGLGGADFAGTFAKNAEDSEGVRDEG